ncbi:PepSY-like domain-containing protein [Sphingobacterium sp. LRF_L2]|uniref:PepSY-like domain-containing protein n=1 Tax=Sphingobacterium sp. LRF_L2 TaxID=3369421 RepID=UPI003F624E35
MKMIRYILVVFLLVSTYSFLSAAEKPIPFDQLPTKGQSFIKQYFAEDNVVSVTLDTEYMIFKEYEVVLRDGSKVEFDATGNWTKVKMKRKQVPLKITPAAILKYIDKSFPNNFVVEIKRSRQMYEVKISNGLELEFNKKGDFLRIDD